MWFSALFGFDLMICLDCVVLFCLFCFWFGFAVELFVWLLLVGWVSWFWLILGWVVFWCLGLMVRCFGGLCFACLFCLLIVWFWVAMMALLIVGCFVCDAFMIWFCMVFGWVGCWLLLGLGLGCLVDLLCFVLLIVGCLCFGLCWVFCLGLLTCCLVWWICR